MSAGLRRDPDRELRIIKLWDDGLAVAQIKERLSCSQVLINRVLAKHGRSSPDHKRHQYSCEGGSGFISSVANSRGTKT